MGVKVANTADCADVRFMSFFIGRLPKLPDAYVGVIIRVSGNELFSNKISPILTQQLLCLSVRMEASGCDTY